MISSYTNNTIEITPETLAQQVATAYEYVCDFMSRHNISNVEVSTVRWNPCGPLGEIPTWFLLLSAPVWSETETRLAEVIEKGEPGVLSAVTHTNNSTRYELVKLFDDFAVEILHIVYGGAE